MSGWVEERGEYLKWKLDAHLAELGFASLADYRNSDLRRRIKEQVFRRRRECEVCNLPAEEVAYIAFLTGRVDLTLADVDGSDTSKLIGLCMTHWWQATHKDGYGTELNMVQVSTKIRQMLALANRNGGTDLAPWTRSGVGKPGDAKPKAPASPAQVLRDRIRSIGIDAKLKMTIGKVTVDVALRTKLVGFVLSNGSKELDDASDFLRRCGWTLIVVRTNDAATTDLAWLASIPEKTMREFRSSIGKGSALKGTEMQRLRRNADRSAKEPPRKQAIKPQPMVNAAEAAPWE